MDIPSVNDRNTQETGREIAPCNPTSQERCTGRKSERLQSQRAQQDQALTTAWSKPLYQQKRTSPNQRVQTWRRNHKGRSTRSKINKISPPRASLQFENNCHHGDPPPPMYPNANRYVFHLEGRWKTQRDSAKRRPLIIFFPNDDNCC